MFIGKPEHAMGLKTGSYLVTLEACREFEEYHLKRKDARPRGAATTAPNQTGAATPSGTLKVEEPSLVPTAWPLTATALDVKLAGVDSPSLRSALDVAVADDFCSSSGSRHSAQRGDSAGSALGDEFGGHAGGCVLAPS
jgi:hypothetical protein